MLISVVIPTLNERAYIERTIASVLSQRGPFEIIVADGGSTDGIREVAHPHARIVAAPRGRARQMNRGAGNARGDVLLFLHADTLLPQGALDTIRHSILRPGIEAGAFRLQFDLDTPLLRFYSLCTRLPVRHLCFGDRGLFVRRDVFEETGGFPDIPLFEDLEFVRLLSRHRGFEYLPLHVTTAARRFTTHGPFRQQLRNAYLWSHYLLGTDPHRLAGLYEYSSSQE